MINLLFYSFAAFGLAWVVGHSKISLPFREWLERDDSVARFLLALLECPGCMGVHIGWISYFYGVRFEYDFGPYWVDMIVLALYTGVSNLIIGKFVGVVD